MNGPLVIVTLTCASIVVESPFSIVVSFALVVAGAVMGALLVSRIIKGPNR